MSIDRTETFHRDAADQQPVHSALKLVLEVIAGPLTGKKFEFDRHATFVVGRSAEAHLCMRQDRSFSRHHFLIEVKPPFCHIRDLGSRNGTKVDGMRVSEASLDNGAVISCGTTKIRVCWMVGDRPASLVTHHCLSCQAESVQVATLSNDDRGAAYICSDCRRQIQNAPQSIPGYEIVRTLGRGGMGIVHLARHQASNESVALKLMIPDAVSNESTVQLFLRKVSVLSQLDHKRIVRFREVGMSQGQFYCAMEYVETINMKEEIAKRPPETRLKTVCGIICQVLEALRYAHRRSFVHRDIKPQNILLTREGRRLRTKLADFGLAKNFENAGFSELTRSGQMRGTFPFMPVEQVLDCRHSLPSGDIYAVGATLYYLLADNYPRRFEPDQDPLTTILHEDIVPIQEWIELPSNLADAIHRALARQPEDRFSSANQMYQALLPYAK